MWGFMSSKRALIVEDNPEIGDIYRLTLEMAGYQSDHIMNGNEALDYFDTSTPDLVVLDMNLPHVSGHYIYKKLRSRPDFSHVPIIISTANTLVAKALESQIGPNDWLLVKPVSPRQLRAIVEGLP